LSIGELETLNPKRKEFLNFTFGSGLISSAAARSLMFFHHYYYYYGFYVFPEDGFCSLAM
jgi:hypothetical protein